MNQKISARRPAATARVVHYGRRRSAGQTTGTAGHRQFKTGEAVRALTQVRNDGIYPHKDIGEILVYAGDVGIVRESWSFLGEIYYTVEFVARAVVVIMRGREMMRAGLPFAHVQESAISS